MSKKNNKLGFTLIELLVVVAILGILVSVAVQKFYNAIYNAKVARAISDIAALKKAIALYKIRNNGKIIDESLSELVPDYMKSIPVDPWNNEYRFYNHYEKSGNGQKRMAGPIVPINSEFDIYSVGKDGKTTPNIKGKVSHDDIIMANDGNYIGLAEGY